MAAEQSDFSQILNLLLSTDNAIRQNAEVSCEKFLFKEKKTREEKKYSKKNYFLN